MPIHRTVPRTAAYIDACHREIARRYAWKPDGSHRQYSRSSPQLVCRRRLNELERLYRHRYGPILPCDDAGIDDLTIAAHHIVAFGGDATEHIVAWTRRWMPDMPRHQAEALAERVIASPRRYKATTLGWRLRLTGEERAALDIQTIRAMGMTDAKMAAERRRKNRERKAADRERQHQREPKAVPLPQSEPWLAFGMSRATWYRKGKPTRPTTVRQNLSAAVRDTGTMLRTKPVSPPAARDKDHSQDRNRRSTRPATGRLSEHSSVIPPPSVASPSILPHVVGLEAVPLVVGTLALATTMVVGDG